MKEGKRGRYNKETEIFFKKSVSQETSDECSDDEENH